MTPKASLKPAKKTERKKRHASIGIHRDDAGNWRWHLKAANGGVAATSNQKFDSKGNARRAGKRAVVLMTEAIQYGLADEG